MANDTLPAQAEEPAMPVPAAHVESLFGNHALFTRPSGLVLKKRDAIHTADQLRAYGQAMAEHARRAALEEAAKLCDDKATRMGQEAEDAAREGDDGIATGNKAAGFVLLVCAARIRAAAQQKGEA